MLDVEMRMLVEDTEQTMKWQSPHLMQMTLFLFPKAKYLSSNVQSLAFLLKPISYKVWGS